MKFLANLGPQKTRRHFLFGLAIVLLAIAIYFDLAEDVMSREPFAWDAPIITYIHQWGSPTIDQVMLVLTEFGQLGALIAAIGAAIYFAKNKNWLDAAALLFSLGAGAAINSLQKLVFLRPRPSLFIPLTNVTGFSFPSGHVTAAGTVFGFLAVILWRKRKRFWAVLCVGIVLAVAISRIYLGAHYPSDTLSALIFCFLWLLVLFNVLDRYEQGRRKTRK